MLTEISALCVHEACKRSLQNHQILGAHAISCENACFGQGLRAFPKWKLPVNLTVDNTEVQRSAPNICTNVSNEIGFFACSPVFE